MSGRPFFSIVMPTYNRAAFLSRSIGSVVGQEFADWELIVVDDGSTDKTKEKLEQWERRDGRIRCVFQPNQGISAARNRALGLAEGRYICFLDSDDAYKEDHLKKIHDKLSDMDHPQSVVVTQYDFHDELSGSSRTVPHCPPPTGEDAMSRIMSVFLPCSPPVQSICHPNGRQDAVLFDPALNVTECYDYCARLASRYGLLRLTHSTVVLYGHEDNVSVRRTPRGEVGFFKQQYSDLLRIREKPFYGGIRKSPAFREKLQSTAMKVSILGLKAGMPSVFILYLARYVSIRPVSLFGYLWLNAKRYIQEVRKAGAQPPV